MADFESVLKNSMRDSTTRNEFNESKRESHQADSKATGDKKVLNNAEKAMKKLEEEAARLMGTNRKLLFELKLILISAQTKQADPIKGGRKSIIAPSSIDRKRGLSKDGKAPKEE